MWSDNETHSDFIDFKHLIDASKTIIDNDQLLPCSIGIYGDWGGGKSSLMNMIETTYENEKDILVIKFNGWLFEGYEDTKTVLLGRILDEVIKGRKLSEKAKTLAAGLLRKVDLLKLTGSVIKYGAGMATGPAGIAGITLSNMMNEGKDFDYKNYLKEDNENPDELMRNNIQNFHQNFEDLVAETKIKKIIVFIDDLDRCTHETIIGTLEAIKLFLFTKKTAFVIGADERLIKYAVRRRFPEIPGDNSEVGRDYLEKMIQYPIRIPPLSELELSIYVNLLFCQLYLEKKEFEPVRKTILRKKNEDQLGFSFNFNNANDFIKEVPDALKEALLLSEQLIPVLTTGLNGNPRQTKRFLNTLLLRSKMISGTREKFEKRILAKLMLMEYFKGETFKDFYEEQARNKGVIPGMKALEDLSENDSNGLDEKENISSMYLDLMEDPWIKNWLASKPSLADVDLQPYFYVSRDKLSIMGTNIRRMSSDAQEIFRKLIHRSETIRGTALQASKNISQGDAATVFESLKEKFLQTEEVSGEGSPLKILFDFCKIRTELNSQLLSMLEDQPDSRIPLVAVTQVIEISKTGSHKEKVKELITGWSKSVSNKPLASIAKKKLTKS
ncbi:KAP family P-loop NTPase fold protein [Salegentibacter flavus]|uniref:Predicted P-loop ATPase, KAP-like n=1 Tax=Salegentibacter flavus TaxID=287099 RepID=A0A1I4ZUS7_9FLAO|nr:P-loop NTPase fold protein [Salegentibacter flavus]SFN53917.1 Predicted P-loop ATPase, KAP-like [Salegentibacter flavus]